MGWSTTLVAPASVQAITASAIAQTLSAALNHAALYIANNVGAWLGRLVTVARHSYTTMRWIPCRRAVSLHEGEEFTAEIGSRFARAETRRTAARMLTAMMSELPTKNCWTLADHAGDRSPDAMRHLLWLAVVDKDGLRDDLRD
ncbi:hypothetical protein ACFXO9_23590 [Nocardia tengchongensis]|uniref:hypothetical protein n=1 Tax=Nocardia tengchongensis TaxID=2055889 RepID=UPI0036B3DF1F